MPNASVEKQETISVEALRSLLSYDPETGKFVWIKSRRTDLIGTEAGGMYRTGYLTIAIQRVPYLAHRLAWFYVYGEWPTGDLDHVNQVRTDNRICNLRPATQTQNNFNQKVRTDSATGVTGVSFCVDRGLYVAQITNKGIHKHLGRFVTFDEAVGARLEAEQMICGEFIPQTDRGPAYG